MHGLPLVSYDSVKKMDFSLEMSHQNPDKQAAEVNAQAWQAYYQQFYNSNQQGGPQGGAPGAPPAGQPPQAPQQNPTAAAPQAPAAAPAPAAAQQPQATQQPGQQAAGYPAPSECAHT